VECLEKFMLCMLLCKIAIAMRQWYVSSCLSSCLYEIVNISERLRCFCLPYLYVQKESFIYQCGGCKVLSSHLTLSIPAKQILKDPLALQCEKKLVWFTSEHHLINLTKTLRWSVIESRRKNTCYTYDTRWRWTMLVFLVVQVLPIQRDMTIYRCLSLARSWTSQHTGQIRNHLRRIQNQDV
jgi:hypothetical protein